MTATPTTSATITANANARTVRRRDQQRRLVVAATTGRKLYSVWRNKKRNARRLVFVNIYRVIPHLIPFLVDNRFTWRLQLIRQWALYTIRRDFHKNIIAPTHIVYSNTKRDWDTFWLIIWIVNNSTVTVKTNILFMTHHIADTQTNENQVARTSNYIAYVWIVTSYLSFSIQSLRYFFSISVRFGEIFSSLRQSEARSDIGTGITF